jgi:WD40 repeat protein
MKGVMSRAFRFCILPAVLILGTGLVPQSPAQERPAQVVTTLTDVVNAAQFSHDGSTLAIARGSHDENRVELWDTRTGALKQMIKGFDGVVWSVSFSPDDRTLVTASKGTHQEKVAKKPTRRNGRSFTELKWWDISTGELKNRLESADDEILSVAAAYSPDGKFLALSDRRWPTIPIQVEFAAPTVRSIYGMPLGFTRSRVGFFDARLVLLDATSGTPRMKLKDGFDNSPLPILIGTTRSDLIPIESAARQVRSAIFSPDGKLLAAWKADEARVWSCATGDEIIKLKKFKGRLTALAFSPDGRLIAAAIAQTSFKRESVRLKSEVRIWEAATGTLRQVIPVKTHAVSSLFFAGNSHQFLLGGLEFSDSVSYPSVELIDTQTGTLGKITSTESSPNTSLAPSADGLLLAFQTDASTIKLLSTTDWRTRYTFGTENGTASDASLRRFLLSVTSVPAVAFLPDGKTVAGAIEGSGVRLWDARTGALKQELGNDEESGVPAAISANGSFFANSSAASTRLWNIKAGTRAHFVAGKDSPIAVALSGDGRTLAVTETTRIVLVDTLTVKTTRIIEGLESKPSFVVLSLDGKTLAAAVARSVKVWNAENGALKQTLNPSSEVSALQFGPNDLIAIGGRDGAVSVWDMAVGTFTFELKKHKSSVNAIAFSSDGKLLATGGDDRTAIIWRLTTRKPEHTLKGHDLAVMSLAFSPDNTKLAVGAGNASVVLWEVSKGKLDRVLK